MAPWNGPNKSQLSQTNTRDALRHAYNVVGEDVARKLRGTETAAVELKR